MADESEKQDVPGEKVTFSPEQQKFIDDIFSKRIGEVNAKHDAEIKEIEKRHQSEIEKSRMDEQTRLKVEEQERIDGLTKRAEEAERKLRITSAEKELAQAGLPTELAEVIMGADNAQMMKNVAALNKVAIERANALYAEKVGSSGAPAAPNGAPSENGSLYQRARAAAGLKSP